MLGAACCNHAATLKLLTFITIQGVLVVSLARKEHHFLDSSHEIGPCNTWRACNVIPTGHVDHSAVAVLHQVSGLAVDPAGCDAVAAEEVRIHRRGLAITPGWRQVCQLRKMEAPEQNHLEQTVYWTSPLVCEVLMQWFDLSANIVTNALICPGKGRCAFIERGTKKESHFNPTANMCTPETVVGAFLLRFSHSYSPSVLSLRCPHFIQELNNISCLAQQWCCKVPINAFAVGPGSDI